MNISIQKADWNSDSDRSFIQSIRRNVFIEEQHVPEEMEWDDDDITAVHCLGFAEGLAVATGRLIESDNKYAQIGRMAVLKNYRHSGIGFKLLEFLIETHKTVSNKDIMIHAQAHAIAFYKRAGFVASSNEFIEAGIPHFEMILKNE